MAPLTNYYRDREVIGIPVSTAVKYVTEEGLLAQEFSSEVEPDSLCEHCKHDRKKSRSINLITKLKNKTDKYLQGIREQVKKGPKVFETVKTEQVETVFGEAFSVSNEEKLIKSSQCFLWTTAGPIAGLLFVSTKKVAFLSDDVITVTSANGTVAQVPYKVLVPLTKIKKTVTNAHSDRPNEKYMQIVTVDDFEFWFMGIVRYDELFKYLQQTITRGNEFFARS